MKAHGGAGSALLGGALTKVICRSLNYKWPGLVDGAFYDSVDDVMVAVLVWAGVYYTPDPR